MRASLFTCHLHSLLADQGGTGLKRNEITLANWQDPEHTAWSYRHIRELIPTARVRFGRMVVDGGAVNGRQAAGHQAFLAMGIHGQFLFADRTTNTVIALVSTWPTSLDPDRSEAVLEAFWATARQVAQPRR